LALGVREQHESPANTFDWLLPRLRQYLWSSSRLQITWSDLLPARRYTHTPFRRGLITKSLTFELSRFQEQHVTLRSSYVDKTQISGDNHKAEFLLVPRTRADRVLVERWEHSWFALPPLVRLAFAFCSSFSSYWYEKGDNVQESGMFVDRVPTRVEQIRVTDDAW
jgi:hypothetical protein